MTIALTSNGLSSRSIIEKYTEIFNKGFKRVAVIVTADPEYRENDLNAISTKDIFEDIGFSADFFDIEFSSPKLLREYDVIYFIGGNPFYLLDQIRKTHTDVVLKEMISSGKVISGSSAGSIVLGTTIQLIHEFDPQMNGDVGLTDFTGVKLTEINLCPHYSRFINRYDNFEERICNVEHTFNIIVTRINDGEAILINNEKTTKI
jgi:dipeptidase E